MTKEDLYNTTLIERIAAKGEAYVTKLESASRQFGMAMKASTPGVQERALALAAKSELEAFAA